MIFRSEELKLSRTYVCLVGVTWEQRLTVSIFYQLRSPILLPVRIICMYFIAYHAAF